VFDFHDIFEERNPGMNGDVRVCVCACVRARARVHMYVTFGAKGLTKL
jgi:hypothetical protein